MSRHLLATIALSLVLTGPGWAACPAVKRSSVVLRQFQRLHPCPSTGRQTGACPGWIRDHQIPLCLGPDAGGKDIVANVTWQKIEEARIKDRWERAVCRAQPRPCPHGGD